MSHAYRCRFSPEQCPDREPRWRLDRIGDAVVDWSCDQHLAGVMEMLQRPWERTEVVVRQAELLTAPAPAPQEGEALGLTDNHRLDIAKVAGDIDDRFRACWPTPPEATP